MMLYLEENRGKRNRSSHGCVKCNNSGKNIFVILKNGLKESLKMAEYNVKGKRNKHSKAMKRLYEEIQEAQTSNKCREDGGYKVFIVDSTPKPYPITLKMCIAGIYFTSITVSSLWPGSKRFI
uniref:Uncharacterized protein n=1 Tax=Timema poppense TaxID=170557 RepID=A0A7R9GXN6_TIMPO|nr:unnamed protein product [Timema poppensis]